jgi:hypothetical protein
MPWDCTVEVRLQRAPSEDAESTRWEWLISTTIRESVFSFNSAAAAQRAT